MEAATLIPLARGRRAGATDDELVSAARAGDDRAFEVLYHRYHRRIAAYVLGMVHDHQRAEDVTQEVFLNAARRMRATDRPLQFKPWLYEIAKNACIDSYRRTRRTDEVSFDADEPVGPLISAVPAPDAAVQAKQQLDDLCGAFGGLSEAHHRILVMRELEGRSYAEIGAELELSQPAVESTLFRARKRLGEEYEELVSGERCRRVRLIIATATESALGVRDRRKMARHVSHCQPCRHAAMAAGLGALVPTKTGIGAKIAALFPLPPFLRDRWLGLGSNGAAGPSGSAGDHGSAVGGSVAGWLHAAAPIADAGSSGWVKIAAAAATVAVAGAGAGVVGTQVGSSPERPARSAPAPTPAAPVSTSGGSGATTASPAAAQAAQAAAAKRAAQRRAAAAARRAAAAAQKRRAAASTTLGARGTGAAATRDPAAGGSTTSGTTGAAGAGGSAGADNGSAGGGSGSESRGSASAGSGGGGSSNLNASAGAGSGGGSGASAPAAEAPATPAAPDVVGSVVQTTGDTVNNVVQTVNGTAQAAVGGVADTVGALTAPPANGDTGVGPVVNNVNNTVGALVKTVESTTGALTGGLGTTLQGLGGRRGGTG